MPVTAATTATDSHRFPYYPCNLNYREPIYLHYYLIVAMIITQLYKHVNLYGSLTVE